MINSEQREILQELGRMRHGKALQEFLDLKYKEIGDISTVKNWEETLGRQFALKLLKELFSVLKENKTTENNKNQYI